MTLQFFHKDSNMKTKHLIRVSKTMKVFGLHPSYQKPLILHESIAKYQQQKLK